MRVSGYFQCECGKMHTLNGIDVTTRCSCGAQLIDQRNRAMDGTSLYREVNNRRKK